MKIILNKHTGTFSNNVENKTEVDFSTKIRLLPNDNIVKNLSLIEQYNEERDECDSFRLILSINPICSNVLYNAKTEIVINEGGANKVICDCLYGHLLKEEYAPLATNSISEIKYLDAIRNTEYSHPKLGGFTYHCGYNIFNNHMLRNDGYVHVNKLNIKRDGSDVYNTIKDYSRRGSDGDIIEQDVNLNSSNIDEIGKTKMHLYTMDNIISMRTAFYERCEERDGWWGFINPSYINIPNRDGDNEDILTNTLIANKKPCDFIDLYPDRSLYSFIPKYNKYRNRLEKNWDYCITYPFENDYEKINIICGASNYSVRVDFIKKKNSNGNEILECNSYFNHNLQVNSKINLYYYVEGNDNIQKYNFSINVENIGDALGENKNKIFTIRYSDIISIYDYLVKTNNNGFYFKRVNNNNECRYYFRKFKKLKNIDGSNIKSDINKIAFGKNIYGDDVAQIIFTDDINIEGLLDNNKRPVSEVYFTVVKRNAGHDIWYESGSEKDSNKNNEKIEFSHCFGKVTSGLDFTGMKNEPSDYNIHMMHNLTVEDPEITEFFKKYTKVFINPQEFIFSGVTITNGNITNVEARKFSVTDNDALRTMVMWGDSVFKDSQVLEDNITIDNDIFYGDVVEYDDASCTETIISNVYHRVNTAQRETFDKCFRDILEDKIIADDFDIYVSEEDYTYADNFQVETYYLNNAVGGGLVWHGEKTKVEDAVNSINGEKGLIYGNIMPEGFYYNPHFRIKLKSDSDVVSESLAILINYDETKIKFEDKMITIIYPTDYGFKMNDYIAFFNPKNNDTYWGEIQGINTKEHFLKIKIPTEILNSNNEITPNDFKGPMRIKLYWTHNSVPKYANLLQEGSKFVWRSPLTQSELQMNDPLYNTTFSNGRLYIEKNINFYLRRQDPFGKYGLSIPKFEKTEKVFSNPVDDFSIKGDKQADFSGLIYSYNNFENCF